MGMGNDMPQMGCLRIWVRLICSVDLGQLLFGKRLGGKADAQLLVVPIIPHVFQVLVFGVPNRFSNAGDSPRHKRVGSLVANDSQPLWDTYESAFFFQWCSPAKQSKECYVLSNISGILSLLLHTVAC